MNRIITIMAIGLMLTTSIATAQQPSQVTRVKQVSSTGALQIDPDQPGLLKEITTRYTSCRVLLLEVSGAVPFVLYVENYNGTYYLCQNQRQFDGTYPRVSAIEWKNFLLAPNGCTTCNPPTSMLP